ncbi:MAG: GNAT family N-acetyltransferase [Actinomycetota bacterium]
MAIDITERLRAHLASWVGAWPPPGPGVHVVGHTARLEPTWDGSISPLIGVGTPDAAVLSVRPDRAAIVSEIVADGLDQPGLGDRLSDALGIGPASFGAGVFRTSGDIDPTIESLGEWSDDQRPDFPDWLAPFNGPRLVARDDDGTVIAGVGIKAHDDIGYELSVVTEEAARGKGYARRLVATAARRVLDEGRVPVYLHDERNVASAHVADAVGFRDEGWRVYGLWPRS